MGKKVVADAGAKANTAATKTQPTKAPAPKVQAPALKQKAADKPKPQQPKEDGDKAQQPQHGGKKKGKRSDIDDIFGMASGSVAPESVALSGADEELQAVAERIKTARDAKAKAGEAKKAGSAPALQGSKDDLFGSETNKNRKRTEEGYAIYTEDELKLGSKGGDTDLCPFDCDCCF